MRPTLHLRLLLSAFAFAACTSSTSPQPSPPSPPSPPPPATTTTDEASVVAGNTALTAGLYRTLRTNPAFVDENIVFSPYSISVALAMTYAGARGGTETEMANALHFELPQDRLHAAFGALSGALASRGAGAKGSDGQPFRLRVANALWGQAGVPFQPAFMDRLASSYSAPLQHADFVAAPDQACSTINGWVAEKTEQRIKQVVPRDAIDDLTRIVLVNAVYFNAAWLVPFNAAENETRPFHAVGGDANATFMAQTSQLRHGRGVGWEAVALPYDGKELEMLAVLPDDGALASFEEDLDGARIASIANALEPKDVHVVMPKFRIEAAFSVKESLFALGMRSAFAAGVADLSGMALRKGDLYVSAVFQTAFIDVTERGTEAAAATAVIGGATGSASRPPPVFVLLDRPFVFAIRDITTGAIVFFGRVVRP